MAQTGERPTHASPVSPRSLDSVCTATRRGKARWASLLPVRGNGGEHAGPVAEPRECGPGRASVCRASSTGGARWHPGGFRASPE
ncbi:hypothetical protein HMPREF0043_01850 [Actinobaculum sp. oral taxon 183 str. F0552]|nr:hypothetical protein HMPREF0043_01850 [Actinobaculum sp. oral taxon 183 str. F0552]